METIERVCRGVLQGCESLEDAVVALAMALTRKVIPPAGKVYLEGKKVQKMEDLREAWETWLSGRQRGNFYKTLMSSKMGEGDGAFRGGQGEGSANRGGVGGIVTCFMWREGSSIGGV